MDATHKYEVNAHWTGARNGVVTLHDIEQQLYFSPPPEFEGEHGYWTPEHLLLSALASCYVATFSAIAQHSNFKFLDLEVGVEGRLDKVEGGWRFSEILIHPVLIVERAEARERGERLLHKAERACIVSRSLATQIVLQAAIRVAEPVAQ